VTPAALRPVVVIVALDRTSLVTNACKTRGDEMSMFRVMSTGVKLVLPDAWPVAESTGADAEKLKDWIWTLLAAMILLFFGTFIVLFTCFSARRHRRDTVRTGKHEAGYGGATTTTTTHKRRFWQRRNRY